MYQYKARVGSSCHDLNLIAINVVDTFFFAEYFGVLHVLDLEKYFALDLLLDPACTGLSRPIVEILDFHGALNPDLALDQQVEIWLLLVLAHQNLIVVEDALFG